MTADSLNAPLEHAEPEDAYTPRSESMSNKSSPLISGNATDDVVHARGAPLELIIALADCIFGIP